MARNPKPSGRKLADKGKRPGRAAIETRTPRPRFLIVCEGEKTEPNYFRGFRVNVDVEVVGAGMNTRSLVAHAKECAAKDSYTETWVVFDRDSFPAEHFNAAIELAKQEGFGVAYSNEAFELWYVLHFNYLDNALHRGQYIDILTQKLGRKYKKNDPTLYETLQPRQADAVRHARRLGQTYQQHHPAQDNPYTAVDELVVALNPAVVELVETNGL